MSEQTRTLSMPAYDAVAFHECVVGHVPANRPDLFVRRVEWQPDGEYRCVATVYAIPLAEGVPPGLYPVSSWRWPDDA